MQTFRAGKLKVRLFDTRKSLGEAAAKDGAKALRKIIKKKGSCSVVFAAAPSQNEFLEALLKEEVDWRYVKAFHMDEYIGLSKDAPQGFGNFLNRGIFDQVNQSERPFQEVNYLFAKEDSPEGIEAEIKRYSRLLKDNPPDIVFLGIGENGHIAFNDPGVAKFDDPALVKVAVLDEVCRQQQVNDGCFSELEEVPTKALTLTVPALFQAKRLFCMVPGSTKAEAVKKTLCGEIREMLPASILRIHQKAVLYIDQESGALL